MRALELATGESAGSVPTRSPTTMNAAATGHGKGPKSTPSARRRAPLHVRDHRDPLRFRRRERAARLAKGGLRVRPGLPALRRRPVAGGGRRHRHRPRRWPRKRRAHGLRRLDRRRPLVLEGRRAGLRLARGRDDRRRAPGRDLQRDRSSWGSRPTAASCSGRCAQDAVRAELSDADRRRRARRLLRPRPPRPRDRVKRGASGWTTQPLWESPEVGAYLLDAGARGRAALRPLASQEGPVVLRGRGDGKDALAHGRAAGRQRGDRGRGREGVRARHGGGPPRPSQKGDAFAPARRYRVAPSPTWAHPVVLDAGVLVKDGDNLAYLRF